MPFIYNTLPKKQHVTVGGKHFEFGPDQIKAIHSDGLANHFVTQKAYMGFVAVPDEVVENPTAPESIATKAEARKLGHKNAIEHLNRVIYNLEVSLRKDLSVYLKAADVDPTIEASEGELEAYKLKKQLEDLSGDEARQRAEEIRKIKEKTVSGNAK